MGNPIGSASDLRRLQSAHEGEILVSGHTGHVGAMLKAFTRHSRVNLISLDLRNSAEASFAADSPVFIHLANDRSAERNAILQENAARMLSDRIHHVVIPMSFSTLSSADTYDVGVDKFNCGFNSKHTNSYITGKLMSERFWIAWQAERPDLRSVAFVYLPSIRGHYSAWTIDVVSNRPEKTVLVPRVERFFTIREENVARTLLDLTTRPSPGIRRIVAFDRVCSLAQAISADRAGVRVKAVRYGPLWIIYSLARYRNVALILDRIEKRCDRIFGRYTSFSILLIGRSTRLSPGPNLTFIKSSSAWPRHRSREAGRPRPLAGPRVSIAPRR